MSYQRVKGSYDIVPTSDEAWKESAFWHFIENHVHTLAKKYALEEIRPPVFEYTDLFLRSVGSETDIVSKEMYTFEDRGGRSLSLRPELTASILRAYIENGLQQTPSQRYYYLGSCFRYERSQKGRYRQFTQFDVEILGDKDPTVDVEVISCFLELLTNLGLEKYTLKINTLGDLISRKNYVTALKEYLETKKHLLSEDSQRRLVTNPMRILDSKEASDQALLQEAPSLREFLSRETLSHFQEVCNLLDSLGISYQIDEKLVRGLDYYIDTVFEVVASDDKGAQNALGGGGRYDGLLKQLGGPDLPGIGFGIGIERVMQALIAEGKAPLRESGPQFFIIPLSKEAKTAGFLLLQKYRKEGKSALLFNKNFQIKKGLQAAEAMHAQEAVILGEEELEKKVITIKNLRTRQERKESL
ncbi:MAG: histidine--tRNA ligase [Verrucomicrobia bacterium]|nr:histidine--tRNA ligase [Verrucomicrobiota bacterium]